MNNNIDRQYKELVEHILHFGNDKADRTGTGTKSIFGWQIRHRMSEGFPILTTKKIHFKSVVTELLWFLQGRTDLRWLLEQGNTIWVGDAYQAYLKSREKTQKEYKEKWGDEISNNPLSKEEFVEKIKTDESFAEQFGNLGKIYGYQWRNWNGEIDQISELIKQLKENPNSRRMVVSTWNASDLPHQILPPCHYSFQVYTRELSLEERLCIADKFNPLIREDCLIKTHHPDETEELKLQYRHEWLDSLGPNVVPQRRAISLMYNARTQDVPLGTTFNIASYALLLEIIAKMVNMVPDELIANMGDCHICLNQIDGVKEQLTRTPYELPKLAISNQVNFNEGIDEFLNSCLITDFTIEGYQSHPTIKMPLSN